MAALPVRRRTSIARILSYVLGAYLALLLVQLFVFNENWDWPLVASYLFSRVIMEALLNTILLTVLTAVFGMILGVLAAWCRLSSLVVLRTIAILYVWVMRATPPLVMILFIYFFGALVPNFSIGVPFLFSFGSVPANQVISQFSAAIIGLSLYLGAYSAEVFRGGVLSVPQGQFEACHALALPPHSAYVRVLGPQILRSITPALANEIITIFKSTSLVSVIGYAELLTTVQTIYAVNFKTIPLLTVAVIWYLVLTSLAMFGQFALERRFSRGFGRRRSPAGAPAETPLEKDML
ncbi:amino acid ABC transporter permease [Microbacterium sp. X-17]|uniref:amino acid ABC transporter permease n=1 Tax=Microbacterium sp. X-17 TaxID=3144404 RepID=UPI0031F4FFA1